MGQGNARARVLVADNDEVALTRAAGRLRRAGYDVLEARDGEEALAQARSAHPDLCVLDAMTPKLTGYDVTRRLRADASTRAMPVILLTARGEDPDLPGLGSGADECIRKPFRPSELRTRVGALLARPA
jgi:DNA-binding response OmpR family regulator